MHNAEILPCQLSMCQCTYYGSYTTAHIPRSVNCLRVYELWYMHNADILLCQLSMCQCTYYGSHTTAHIPRSVNCLGEVSHLRTPAKWHLISDTFNSLCKPIQGAPGLSNHLSQHNFMNSLCNNHNLLSMALPSVVFNQR